MENIVIYLQLTIIIMKEFFKLFFNHQIWSWLVSASTLTLKDSLQ